MKTTTKTKKIIPIILIIIALLILIALLCTHSIITQQNKTQIAISESGDTVQNINIPNAPKLSAGMIPVKNVNNNWVITKKTASDWYDYDNYKPAYIMLNDGTYQSEVLPDMTGKKLASENIDTIPETDELGSIYMWIPRFEVNDTTGEIKYIQNVGEAEDGYTIPDLFMYKQAETMPDFLLTGVWVAIDTDTNYATTIINMQNEDGIYGFLANTVGVGVPDNPANQTAIETFANIEESIANLLTDLTNTNRVILKILNNANIDPIKATATFNIDTMEVSINVTYSRADIAKIEETNGNILTENSKTAVDTNIPFNGTYYYTITDKQGNIKKLELTVDITPTLTFNVNGGTTTVENITAGYGDTITLPIPERIYTVKYVTNNSQTLEDSLVEYTFDGWYTAATDGEKRGYLNMPAHNETLYAHWIEASVTLPKLTPESKYIIFDSWYIDSEFLTSVGNIGTIYVPTANVTLYAKWETLATLYGREVNYTCSSEGVDTWRIFHIDESTDNIYIIADNYIPNTNLPTTTAGNNLNKLGTYGAYFSSTLNDYSTGSAWILENTNSNARKWLTWVDKYPTSTNNNIKAVAYMMDTDSWSGFVNSSYAEYALGGPTLELYCASYKVTHPNKYIECDSVTTSGYQVKWNTATSYSSSVSGLATSNDFNNIYIINGNAKGCWLASPAYSSSYISRAGYGSSVDSEPYYYENFIGGAYSMPGFRPIVCLKSTVELVNNGDGTYSIQ